jgi:CheY-like chemotaxis protein
LRDSEGEITGYLGIARDISAIKRIDQMKNEFISTVSHELRTPLTAISGALGILVNGLAGDLPAASARMIKIAHNNSQRLIHLVNDILDMEKLVAGKMHFDIQPQMLLPIIQQSIESNAAFAQQYGVTYRLLPGADVKVAVDQQRLLQVLANYLSNAAKFSPLNDVVSISVDIHFNNVRVTVTDNGPGIPEGFRARLFQKFSQADSSDTRQKGGTGLGLAICKEMIERMGGTLGVDSIPGEGASFYFDLPCENPTQKIPFTRVEPKKIKQHLLVIENDPETAGILTTMLAAQAYDVDWAATGQSAWEHLQLRDYDLITLDLQLPDMNGVEIVERIRQQESYRRKGLTALPIVIITGALDEDKINQSSLGSGDAIFWLQKPLVAGQLERVIAQALEQQATPVESEA